MRRIVVALLLFTVDQGSDVVFDTFTMTRVARSAVDVEPQQDWIVNGVTVQNGSFTAPIANAIFANLGTGGGVTNVLWQNNQIHGRAWSASMSVTNGTVRDNYTFTNNDSDTATNHPPVYSFTNIGHVTVSGAYQAFSGKWNGSPVISWSGTSCGTIADDNQFPGSTQVLASPFPACQ